MFMTPVVNCKMLILKKDRVKYNKRTSLDNNNKNEETDTICTNTDTKCTYFQDKTKKCFILL